MKPSGGTKARIIIAMVLVIAVTGIYPVKGQEEWVVGIDKYYPPHEYWANGTAKGFNVDIINAIAEKMGITVRWTPLVWGNAEEALINGTVDSLCMSITEDRRSRFDFSKPILNLTPRIFVRTEVTGISNIHELAGHTVAVEYNDVAHTMLVQQVPNATIVPVSTQEEAIRLVARGEVTAAFCNEYAGTYAIIENNFSNVKKIGTPVVIGQRAIAVLKGNTALLTKINNTLAELFESGEYDNIVDSWFGTSIIGDSTAAEVVRGVIILLTIASLAAIGLVGWNWYLHNRVKHVTERLSLLIDIFRHDLRNIGQSLLVSLQLIEMDPNLSQDSRKILDTAFTALSKSQQLTNDFSTIEALTAGRVPTRSMQLTSVMESALQRAMNICEGIKVKVIYNHSEGVHIEGCDILPDAISRAIMFLAGGPQLKEVYKKVWILTKESRLYIHIYIGADTPTAPEVHRSLLLRYLGSKNYGIGLDLSLVHATITACHGSVEVTDKGPNEKYKSTVLHIILRKMAPANL